MLKSKKRDSKKLIVSRETLMTVSGSAWHRTSFRCHQTYTPITCNTYQGTTCWTCPGWCGTSECTIGCGP